MHVMLTKPSSYGSGGSQSPVIGPPRVSDRGRLPARRRASRPSSNSTRQFSRRSALMICSSSGHAEGLRLLPAGNRCPLGPPTALASVGGLSLGRVLPMWPAAACWPRRWRADYGCWPVWGWTMTRRSPRTVSLADLLADAASYTAAATRRAKGYLRAALSTGWPLVVFSPRCAVPG